MQTGLFRAESLESRHLGSLGTVRIGLPRFTRRAALLAIVAMATALAVLSFGSYTRRDRVAGQLLPTDGVLDVVAGDRGVIKRLRVKEGDLVQADQALLELSTDTDGAQTGSVAAAVADELQLQRERLREDLADTKDVGERNLADARQRLASVRSELAVLDEDLEVRGKQLRSARNLLDALRPLLEKGQVSRLEYERQDGVALDAETHIHLGTLQKLEARRRLDAAQEDCAKVPLEQAQKRREIERRIAEVDQEIAKNDARRSVIVNAPRAGVVSGVTVANGVTVAPGARLLAIIPENSRLQAELWISSHDIGFVAPGKPVAIRYHAYPYERYDQQSGRVRDVASSAVMPVEAERLTGRPFATPVYRVIVELEEQALVRAGESHPLRANMTLDADIPLERRRLIEWLFAPAGPEPRSADVATTASRAVPLPQGGVG